jgi:diadenosine tetraphosphate (Ap4A) HIT family hydrolase
MADAALVDGCEICAVLRDPPSEFVVFQTEWWKVTLNPDQSHLGRVWMTLLEHRAAIPDLTSQQLADFQSAVRRYEIACRAAFGAVLLNLSFLTNNAYKVQPPLPHAHWHVRPRYSANVRVGAWTFADWTFGYHYDAQRKWVAPDELLQEVQAQLVEALPAA